MFNLNKISIPKFINQLVFSKTAGIRYSQVKLMYVLSYVQNHLEVWTG